MLILESAFALITIVLISNVVSHYLPAIPASLIQIGLGLVATVVFKLQIKLDTDWFLLLFIAPLLFNDGRKFPKRELWKLRGPIFANAIILVFVTTLLGGFLIYRLVPEIPLYASFALAAILSPTDPIAVQSIAKQANLDSTILHLVSGESLINDASGLIGFKYAIAAVTTGYFSLSHASSDFLYTALVGLIVGLIVMVILELIHDFLQNQGIQDLMFDVAYRVLAPFIVYLIAEEGFHSSGVIAVVTAGVYVNTRNYSIIDDRPEMTLVTERMWSILVYLLNGTVFVILGVELPVATAETLKMASFNNLDMFGYVIATWLILLFIRIIWILVYEGYQYLRHRRKEVSLRSAVLVGLSGVRGAITMAGVLSVPMVVASGAAFPARSLMLFIAAGVIILSLVVAVVVIPILTKVRFPFETRGSNVEFDQDPDDQVTPDLMSIDEAKYFLMQIAVQTIEEHRREDNSPAAYDLILNYQILMRRLRWKTKSDAILQQSLDQELQLRSVAFNAEREALQHLLSRKMISATEYYQSVRRLDQLEHRLIQELKASNRWWTWRRLKNQLVALFHLTMRWIFNQSMELTHRRLIEIETSKAAINALSKHVAEAQQHSESIERAAVYHLIVVYRNRIAHAKRPKLKVAEQYQTTLDELQFEAVNAQRLGISQLRDAHRISAATVQNLKQYLNYTENSILQVDEEM